MDSQVMLLVEGARKMVQTIPPPMVEGSDGVSQYQDGNITVICRGKALTVYLSGFEDPVLLVSSRGTILHVEEKAKNILADRFP